MDPHRQPLPEIARTNVRAGAARLFIAACGLSLLLVPLFQHVLPSGDEWGLRAGPFADFTASVGNVGEGTAGESGAWDRFFGVNRALKQHMDDLERELERVSHVHEQAYPITQWLLLAYGGAGNERVYPGRGGWLYLRSGFDYLTGPPFLDPAVLERRRQGAPAWLPLPEPDPRPAILDFARQLARRGIHLLILPAPTKAMVHPEPLGGQLPAAADQGLQNPSFDAFRAQLEAAGITVFDPAPVVVRARRETGEDQFLRTDSHWSPEGLDAVASALADRIRGLDLPFAGAAGFRRRPRPVEDAGDLARILLLPPWQQVLTPQAANVQRVVSAAGRPWRSDPRAEILLLGDSFTNVYAQPDVGWGRGGGLAEQLSYHLGRPIDRLAINAGGASGTRRRLAEELAAGRDRLAGKQLVIFQFAVRELAVGDWQLVELLQRHADAAFVRHLDVQGTGGAGGQVALDLGGAGLGAPLGPDVDAQVEDAGGQGELDTQAAGSLLLPPENAALAGDELEGLLVDPLPAVEDRQSAFGDRGVQVDDQRSVGLALG